MSRPADFDLRLHISPFTLFRRLREGPAPELVDLRPPPSARPPSLARAAGPPGPGWRPPAGVDVVLFDDDGHQALALVRRLRSEGHGRVFALFGGLELWDLALGDFEP